MGRYLYELSCEWNYVVWQCREEDWVGPTNPRTRSGMNNCPAADEAGVAIIHGNSATFHNKVKEYFSLVLVLIASKK